MVVQKLCKSAEAWYAGSVQPPAMADPDRSVAPVSRHVPPVLPSDAEHELELVLQASDAPVYNTTAVARRCQLPAATFQAWERRYGFPEPRRGPGRQRLYSE